MKITNLLLATMAALIALMAPKSEALAAWPSDQKITMVIAAPSGASTDVTARIYARFMEKELGQSIIVENKPGASSLIAAQDIVRSPPDGYKFLFSISSITLLPLINKNISIDPNKDLIPLSPIANNPHFLITKKGKFSGLDDMINVSSKSPLTMSIGAPAAPVRIDANEFAAKHGIKIREVPYRGMSSTQTIDIINGDVDFTFAPAPIFLPVIDSLDVYKKYELPLWTGTWLASGTPVDIITKFHAASKRVLASSTFKAELEKIGASSMLNMTLEQFKAFVNKDFEMRKPQVDRLNLRQ